jgi:8-oxo-dGTP pyrophosphatase MutT (NUDIX family)
MQGKGKRRRDKDTPKLVVACSSKKLGAAAPLANVLHWYALNMKIKMKIVNKLGNTKKYRNIGALILVLDQSHTSKGTKSRTRKETMEAYYSPEELARFFSNATFKEEGEEHQPTTPNKQQQEEEQQTEEEEVRAEPIYKTVVEEALALIERVRANSKSTFICVYSVQASESALLRNKYMKTGANMVTSQIDLAFCLALRSLAMGTSEGGGENLSCPSGEKIGLSEDELWAHYPMHHAKDANTSRITCPICKKVPSGPFPVHLHNRHGPPGRGEILAESKDPVELYAFGLIVCQRHSDGKFLLVHEVANWGWWLPGGRLDPGENPLTAAVRETKEEGGIDVKVTGLLSIQYSSIHSSYTRMRFIFYAIPVDEEQEPKQIPDYESIGAAWVTYDELAQLPLRGSEPAVWFKYVIDGGTIHPISLLQFLEK